MSTQTQPTPISQSPELSVQARSEILAGIAKRVGFDFGDDSVAMFLSAASVYYPQVSSEEKFFALDEKYRERIIVRIKTKRLTGI
jgi:hypothetical protein